MPEALLYYVRTLGCAKLKENSFDDLPLIYEKLRLEYGAIAKKGNEVAAYNNELLYLSLVK